MTHLSLFSGIGGLDLAAEWAGFKTVGQCEWADYPTKILEKHWPDIPRWRDIRTLNKDDFYARTGLRTVDVISGGFPCQPFSVAGKRRGKEDDRYLWPEMLRVIHELQPSWVVGENVAGIVNLALDQVLSDLENIGYTCQAFIIPACGVDAPHRRDRVAIVAHTDEERLQRRKQHEAPCNGEPHCTVAQCGEAMADTQCDRRRQVSNQSCYYIQRDDSAQKQVWGDELCATGCNSEFVPDSLREGLQITRYESELKTTEPKDGTAECGWWAAEPDVGRVANGIPNRMDRLKCLGNAVVPQQFYPIFKAIADIEEAA